MIIFCVLMLLTIAFVRIVPCAPAGIIRTGTGIYACMICTMLVMALLQRSSLYALGAVLFVFSDFILAWNKFVEPVTYSRLLIMIPHHDSILRGTMAALHPFHTIQSSTRNAHHALLTHFLLD